MKRMPKITTIAKLWTDANNQLPEFGQLVLGFPVRTKEDAGKEVNYVFVSLKSVVHDAKGNHPTFVNIGGVETAITHWLYLVPPSKEQPKTEAIEAK